MCIAIYRPKGASLSKKTLWNCWSGNKDGAGFMYAEGGTLHVEKGFFKFKPLWKALRPHLFENDKDLVLHFRIATSGKVDTENCHPHLIHPNLAYVHNGIISELNNDKNVCDTIRFASILKTLPDGFIERPEILALIEMAVGYNKMVFMDGEGRVAFINKEHGIESEGVWYSNGGFRGTKSTVSWGYSRGYYQRGCGSTIDDREYEEGGYLVRATPTGKVYTPLTAAEVARRQAAAKEAQAEDERQEALIDEGDYPHYAMFDTFQRFDVDLGVIEEVDDDVPNSLAMIEDEYGYSEYDYTMMAEEDIEWWQRHPDRLTLAAHMAIMEIDSGSRTARYEYQAWIDLWEPEWASQHSHVNCPGFKAAITATETKAQATAAQTPMTERIQEVVNLTTGALTKPEQLLLAVTKGGTQ